MGIPTRIEQVQRTGIRELSEEKIRSVRAAGMRYKLVCRAERRGDGVDCRVSQNAAPVRSDGGAGRDQFGDPVRPGCFWAVVVEHNPGLEATGYGLLADFLRAVQD